MDTADIPDAVPSMWQPMDYPLHVALVGKAQEEIAELIIELAKLQNLMGRSLIQGIDGLDPSDLISNRAKITDEIADVMSKLHQFAIDFKLDDQIIQKRWEAKFKFSALWFDWLRPQLPRT